MVSREPILNDEDRATIDEALAVIEETEEDVNRAKLAGIDVADIEKRRSAAKNKLMAIKRAFFPNSE